MATFAEKVIHFYQSLQFSGVLPEGVRIMNPFQESDMALHYASIFYNRFYADHQNRHMIIGINPGRFGAAVTGIPFTDTKRLKEKCLLDYKGKETHEPSSVFIYEVIDAFGGLQKFCEKYFITAVCPLGFTNVNEKGKEVNYNYYDSKELIQAVQPFITWCIEEQLSFGINRDVCFCLGTGKNEQFLRKLNREKRYFKEIIALEHPRFVVQYKSRLRHFYVEKYLNALA